MGSAVTPPPGFELDTAPNQTPLPPGFVLDQPQAVQQAAQQSAPESPSLFDRYKNSFLGKIGPLSVIEPIANMATGMLATPVAGLAGIGKSALNATGITDASAADTVESVSNLAYQPQTPGGKIGTDIVQYPFKKLAQGADWVGEKIASATGSPAAGAAVNAGIQFLPALLLKGRAGAKAAPATAAESAAEQAATQAKGAPLNQAETSNAHATGRAQEFVSNRTSLDWNSVSAAVKTRLTDIAKNAQNLDLLDAKAIERQAQLESLPTPVAATRGQLTRDAVQLRNEGNISATEAGKPLRETYIAQTQALLKNLDILKGKVKGRGARASTAETPEQVGMAVQDVALREKAAASERKYNFLYKKARATEPDAKTSAEPFFKMLEQNPEVQHMGFMSTWLGKAKLSEAKSVKLSELQDLREKASGIARAGGTDGYYAGQVVRAIDGSMQDVPAAAKAWKDAQSAFAKHKTEFSEQGAVEKLVTDKSRTDRATALEDTWKQVVQRGSIEDLQKVKRSLLTGEDKVAKNAGIKAWRDIRAQTVQHIINEATKSVTRYEDGTPNLTPASMERAIKSIGNEKLTEIFGSSTVNQINKIMEATRLVKTEPPAGFKGSPTLANIIALMEKSIGKIPFLGDTVTGAVKGVANLKDLGANQREVRNTMQTPLDEAVRTSAQQKMQRGYGNSLRRAAPTAQTSQERKR